MKLWAQFYQCGTVTGQPVEGCGDRSVIEIDNRHNISVQHNIAERECLNRGYIGYQLVAGDHLLAAVPKSPVRLM